jgi:hypothetical protein
MNLESVWFWSGNIARIAPIVTAVVAIAAGALAWISIATQKSIARRRAAIDFFLKTEMDDKMLDAYKDSRDGFESLREGTPVELFGQTPATKAMYKCVRKYLNVHELMAVGIHHKVLSDKVCYAYWADELMKDYKAAEALIAHIRVTEGEGTEYTYKDLERLNQSWKCRLARAQRRTGYRESSASKS